MGQHQQWKVQCMILNAGISRWVDGLGSGGGGAKNKNLHFVP